MKPEWKVGDWAVFERSIIQIKQLEPYIEVSDGMFCTSGPSILDRLRPLTLRNKRFAEWFDAHYNYLNDISGHGGFNFPDINRHFNKLTLQAIDAEGDEASKPFFDAAQEFVREARNYTKVIQGVHLFRPQIKATA